MKDVIAVFYALCSLRWCAQVCHWNASGDAYYGDHIMFQRIYEELDPLVDTFAEIVANTTKITHHGLLARMQGFSESEEDANPIQAYLTYSQDLAKMVDKATSSIGSSEEAFTGIQDSLGSLGSTLNTHQYLLQRRLKPTKLASRIANSYATAEGYFFDNPQRREIREFAESKKIRNGVPGTPMTPNQILDLPNAEDLSTLNRFKVTDA